MTKLMPQHIERHLSGLRAMTAHAERLYRQGVLTADELEHARTYALEQRMGPLSDTETYIKARESGDFDKFEQIMNDPRSGTAAQREMVARKVAAHKIGQDAVNYQPKDEAEQKAVMKAAREKMSTFVDRSDEDADNDLAVYEKAAKITLGDEVRKPVEVPSWSKPVQRLSDDDASARDFRLRDENTFGTARYNKAYDGQGVKRDANGRILAKSTLREEADKPKPKKSEWDDTRGFTVDKEYGVRTAEEAADIERDEQSQRNDAAAAADASPPPPSDPGPVTLPNPGEA